MTRPVVYPLLVGALFVPGVNAIAATQLYNQWTDEKGHAHYSDRVAPEDAKHDRNKLDKHGYIVEHIEAVKTPQEQRREHQLRTLRAEKDRLLAVQQDRDRALLRSFKNTSELDQTLQKNLTTVDVSIRITQSNIQQLNDKIKNQQKKAAKYELKGSMVPAHLLKQIQASNKQMDNYRQRIASLETEKIRIKRKFGKDTRRFDQLIAQNQTTSSKVSLPLRQINNSTNLSLFTCTQNVNCNHAWKLAKTYLTKHATTRLQIDTDQLLYTENPRKERDISLSVSKITHPTGLTQLFLDLRCKPSSIGRELCSGSKAISIRSGFVSFISAKLH